MTTESAHICINVTLRRERRDVTLHGSVCVPFGA